MPGALWAFGLNSTGQLGTGTYTTYPNLVQVGTAVDWAWVNTSGYHSLGVKSGGTLWAWGDNSHGELGLGASPTSQLTPVQVGSDSNWSKVWCAKAGSMAVTLALKTDGTLYACGTDATGGLLGLGVTTSANTLTQVGSSTYTTVRVGVNVATAIETGGTVVAWGQTWGNAPTSIARTGYVFKDAFPALITAYPESLYATTLDGALWLWLPSAPLVQCGTSTSWLNAYVGRSYQELGSNYVTPAVRSDNEIYILSVSNVSRRPLYRTQGYTSSAYWTLLNSEPEMTGTVSHFKGHHAVLSNNTLANVISGEVIAPPHPDNAGWLNVSENYYTFPKLDSYPVTTGIARFIDNYPTLPNTQAYFFIRSVVSTGTGAIRTDRDVVTSGLHFTPSSLLPGSITICVRLGSDTGSLLTGVVVTLFRSDNSQLVGQATTDGTGTVTFSGLDKTVTYYAIGQPGDSTARVGSIRGLVAA